MKTKLFAILFAAIALHGRCGMISSYTNVTTLQPTEEFITEYGPGLPDTAGTNNHSISALNLLSAIAQYGGLIRSQFITETNNWTISAADTNGMFLTNLIYVVNPSIPTNITVTLPVVAPNPFTILTLMPDGTNVFIANSASVNIFTNRWQNKSMTFYQPTSATNWFLKNEWLTPNDFNSKVTNIITSVTTNYAVPGGSTLFITNGVVKKVQ